MCPAKSESSREIDDAAAVWVARIDRAPLSDDEQSDLDAWLAGDSRRRGAFARANAIMVQVEQAGQSGAWVSAAPLRGLSRRTLFLGGSAIAASLAAAAVMLGRSVPARSMLLKTAKGEIRYMPMSDGSSVTLNTNSVLRVSYSSSRRDVELVSGEAFFEVAKDHQRPFIVSAGETRVRAVGTRFSVRLKETGVVSVLVSEGVVEVRNGQAQPVRAAANVLATVPPASVAPSATSAIATQQVGAHGIASGLAWRGGMLSFDGQSLAEAAAEFDRYSRTRIVVDDPELAQQPLTGLFSASDPRAFAKAAASALNGRVSETGDVVHISR